MMKSRPAARLTKQTVTADGPQEFRLHSRYELGTATILEQDMIFRAESTLVEWQTVLHWNEKHRAESGIPPPICAPKQPDTRSSLKSYIERPTTANDTREQAMFERRNHRYTDLSEPGRGLASSMTASMASAFRAEPWPDAGQNGTRPDERGDVGTYTFRYAIQPHAGRLQRQGALPRHAVRPSAHVLAARCALLPC